MRKKEIVGKVSLKNKILRSLWNIVWLFLFRPFGTKFFLLWRLLLLKIFGAKICWILVYIVLLKFGLHGI